MLTATWTTKNPGHAYYLFDEHDNHEFIKRRFGDRVHSAYRRLIPGAYRANLWRYCVLYVFGGIGVDLDCICVSSVDNFLEDDTELLITVDRPIIAPHMLYSSFIAVVPNHPVMLDCVNRIVSIIESGKVPPLCYDISNSGQLGMAVNMYLGRAERASFAGMGGIITGTKIKLLVFDQTSNCIIDSATKLKLSVEKDACPVLTRIYDEEKKRIGSIRYDSCSHPISPKPLSLPTPPQSGLGSYASGSIVLKKIPRNLFQTWKTAKLSPTMQMLVSGWISQNPKYFYQLDDDNGQKMLIQQYFGQDVLNAYLRLIPGAFKADLWRLCALYVFGGVYVDIDTICLGDLDGILDETTEFVTVIDLIHPTHPKGHALFNGFIAAVPKHPVLLDCIKRIVANVEREYTPALGLNWELLDVTGPGVLGRAMNVYLGRGESDSFQGMHGTIVDGKIKLLLFEPRTEIVRDAVTSRKIFQNKNGNAVVQTIYDSAQSSCGLVPYTQHKRLYHGVSSPTQY